MGPDDKVSSIDSSGTPVVGIRSDVYERRLELIWMSKDDIEHFESRIGDKTLFQSIALFFLSASVPLLVEKGIDYEASAAPTDLALVIVCIIGVCIGVLFQILALLRRKKLTTFRNQLFQREKKLSTTFTMMETSPSTTEYKTKGAA